jgi:hypothetical protein
MLIRVFRSGCFFARSFMRTQTRSIEFMAGQRALES